MTFNEHQSIPHQPYPGARPITHFDLSPPYAGQSITRFISEWTERVAAMEESLLAGVIADEMRRRGYTVIAPHDPVDPPDPEVFADDPVCSVGVKGCNDWHGDVRLARQGDLDRHAEKQGCSYSDAWNYFRDMGYDMSQVDNWDAR